MSQSQFVFLNYTKLFEKVNLFLKWYDPIFVQIIFHSPYCLQILFRNRPFVLTHDPSIGCHDLLSQKMNSKFKFRSQYTRFSP